MNNISFVANRLYLFVYCAEEYVSCVEVVLSYTILSLSRDKRGVDNNFETDYEGPDYVTRARCEQTTSRITAVDSRYRLKLSFCAINHQTYY